MRSAVAGLTGLCSLLLAVPPAANAQLHSWGLTSDGDPSFATAADAELYRCPEGGACTPVTGALGETAPGTVFEARHADGRTERTPAWRGRVASGLPPTTNFPPGAGGVVAPVPGAWSGGWGDERTYVYLAICPTAAPTNCRPLQSQRDPRVVAGDEQGLIPADAGVQFLLAVEARGPERGLSVRPPYSPELRFDLPAPTPLLTVTNLGVIGIPSRVLVKPPAVTLRSRAVRSQGRLLLGHVTCATRCTVQLAVSGGGRKLSRTFASSGRTSLRVPVRHGRLNVRVRVDGKLIANGVLRAR